MNSGKPKRRSLIKRAPLLTLNIHHINYIKKNCHPWNLISLCRGCNTKANYNRRWHKHWYQAIMYRRYGYNYEK